MEASIKELLTFVSKVHNETVERSKETEQIFQSWKDFKKDNSLTSDDFISEMGIDLWQIDKDELNKLYQSEWLSLSEFIIEITKDEHDEIISFIQGLDFELKDLPMISGGLFQIQISEFGFIFEFGIEHPLYKKDYKGFSVSMYDLKISTDDIKSGLVLTPIQLAKDVFLRDYEIGGEVELVSVFESACRKVPFRVAKILEIFNHSVLIEIISDDLV